MKIISFAWTTPALLAGRKTVTRREWTHGYALRFGEGDLVQAWDRNPRHGGHQVATIRLTRDPYQEDTKRVPPEDYEAEGFAFLEGIDAKIDGLTPRTLWRAWFLYPKTVWVVRFDLVEVGAASEPKAAAPQLAMEMETPA